VVGDRQSEVKKESRAQHGADDMSGVGYLPPLAGSDLQRMKHFMYRKWYAARGSN
jgi:hypothetical protein